METLECLPHVFGSARALIGPAGYRLGLVAIGMRSNPYGAAVKANPEQVRMAMAHGDPRQRGLFGAAWALGALAATDGFAVERIALAAPAGPFGLVYRPMPVAQPGYDERALADSRHARRVKVASSAPQRGAALAYASDRDTTVWLANLSAEPETVAINGVNGVCTQLEPEHLEQAAAAPDWFETVPGTQVEGKLELGAHALARIRLAQ